MIVDSYELNCYQLPGFPGEHIQIWMATLHAAERTGYRVQARRMRAEVLIGLVGQDNCAMARAEGGKPYLRSGELEFNLSHSGTVACLATSPTVPVGVDVERVRTFRNTAGMRRRICTAAELDSLDAIPDRTTACHPASDAATTATVYRNSRERRVSVHDQALTRLWVRKEAVVKASGEGIVRDLNQIDVLGEVVDDGRGEHWRCVDLPAPAPGYVAAVAFRPSKT